MGLEGKVCVVTGAGSGIGRATAIEMARRGGKVVVSDVNDEQGKRTVETIRGDGGGDATYIHADISSNADVEALMRHAVETFGRLDVLHNNAGIHESDLTDKLTNQELPEEVWDRIMDVNVKGTWRCSRAAYPHLRDAGGGAIVNAASVCSLAAYPYCPVYVPTKHAILGMTRQLAVDFREAKIRVNCYCPAAVDTQMTATVLETAQDRALMESILSSSHVFPKRIAKPEEVAKLVCFLASDEAEFVNGSAYSIDAGAIGWRGSE